ncbi:MULTISPECIES: hypothetical protein [Clostridium]|uniref:Uncharacterized protein n=1 Tax=Candidatus Clostridium helianthi TaxID=3381660 RepID=A0ABW8S5C8_9CLOT|nr:hypothetical protein [Clostridium beijerinckii]UYZ34956.1 hypothetical protein OD350_22315 [Clostridium beijerinckii]
MAKVNILKELDHLGNLCKESSANVIIFTVKYNNVNFKCIYMNKINAILLAAEDYNTGFSIRINTKGQLDNYFPKANYEILKTIYKNSDFKTKILCNRMLEEIKQLKLTDIKINSHCYSNKNNIVLLEDDDKIYFKCWARNRVRSVRSNNLEKTRKHFGREVYEICKKCNISSRWSSKFNDKN